MTAEGVAPFGDRALRFPLAADADRRSLLASLRAAGGVADVVLTEDAGAVVLAEGAELSVVKEVVAAVLARGSALASPRTHACPPARHVVRVVYDGEDLADVAARLGTSPADVVALHANRDYEVAMLGFLPGFAYLRGLDPTLVLPRRAEPRTRVPAGSVAIAAEYTGIYPLASPGGWHLLGRAVGPRIFDARGAAFALGDRVRFERATDGELEELARPSPTPAPHGVHLEIVRAQGPVLVIDGGRIGHMHEGVPHGGPMVVAAHARANIAAGNAPGAAAIEIYGSLEVVARGGGTTVSDDTGVATLLADGASFAIATEGRSRVRYLAIAGGLDVPLVLGSRSTLLVASLGGHEGRLLKRGDHLSPLPLPLPHQHQHQHQHQAPTAHPTPPLSLLPGPDADAAILTALTHATFTISSRSDRIGTRLDGPPLPPDYVHTASRRRSSPMVLGAIERTPAGLVVLGPDHPTTGGYPVIGVLPSDALDALMSLPIGAPVRLVVAREKTT